MSLSLVQMFIVQFCVFACHDEIVSIYQQEYIQMNDQASQSFYAYIYFTNH